MYRGNAELAQEIRTLALAGDRLFIGGGFPALEDEDEKTITPETAFLAELDARTGQPAADQTFAVNAAPDDTVEWMVPAPDGKRLYVAGRFRHIGGGESPYIAALDMRTGLLDPTFNPPDPDGDLRHVDISADRVFIGGEFLKVGNTEFPGVAALNMADGSLVEGWTPPINYGGSYISQSPTYVEQTQGVVEIVKVADDGKMLLVGGTFEHLGWPRNQDPKAEQLRRVRRPQHLRWPPVRNWHPQNDREVHGHGDVARRQHMVYIVEGGSGGLDRRLRPGRPGGPAVDRAGRRRRPRPRRYRPARAHVGGHFDAEVPNHDAECLKHIPTHCVGRDSAHQAPPSRGLRHEREVRPRTGPPRPTRPRARSVLLAGPHFLYVGGNFQNILERSAQSSTAAGGSPTPASPCSRPLPVTAVKQEICPKRAYSS